VAKAELCQEGIDCSDLYAGTTATISQLRGVDVVIAIGHKKRYRRKPIQDLGAGSRAEKALKQLLKDEARRHQRFTRFKGVD
jgi:hypothetical protein